MPTNLNCTSVVCWFVQLGQMVNLASAHEAKGLIVDTGFFLAGNGKWEMQANYEGEFLP